MEGRKQGWKEGRKKDPYQDSLYATNWELPKGVQSVGPRGVPWCCDPEDPKLFRLSVAEEYIVRRLQFSPLGEMAS